MKKIYLLFCIILLIATIGIASATENTADSSISVTDKNDTIKSYNEIDDTDITSSESTQDVLSDDEEMKTSSISLSTNSITAKSKSQVSLTATVLDENSEPLNTGFVSIYIDGTEYTSDVIEGNAKLTFKMPSSAGSRYYDVSYFSQDSTITDSYKTVKLTSKIGTKLIVKTVSGNPGKALKLKATLKTNTNKAIPKVTITFKFNGKTYKAKTNSKGIAEVKTKYPAAKYYKTVKKIKGNILTKTTYYQKAYTCKVSFSGKGNYENSVANYKVTSKKKPTVKKYRHVNYKTITVPFKKGQHKYTRGSIAVLTADGYEDAIHYILIAAGNLKTKKIIKISTKLQSKYPNGKWTWDSSWEPSSYDDELGGEYVFYYYNTAPVNKVKIRYYSPHYKLIK